MGIETFIGPFTGSYVRVHRPKLNKQSGKDEYSVLALFDKGFDSAPLKKLIFEACVQKWGAEKAAIFAKNPKFKMVIKDQAEMANTETGELYVGMTPGLLCANLKSHAKPLTLDERTDEVTDERVVYSGARYKAKVDVYAWEAKEDGKIMSFGASFGLLGLQKIGDGPKLGGTGNRAEVSDFQPVGDGTTASDVFGGASDDPFGDAPSHGAKRAQALDDDIPF